MDMGREKVGEGIMISRPMWWVVSWVVYVVLWVVFELSMVAVSMVVVLECCESPNHIQETQVPQFRNHRLLS